MDEAKPSPSRVALASAVQAESSPIVSTTPLRLTLPDAIEMGLLQNPDLVALRTQEGVSLAALGVAKTYPWNPVVQSEVLPRGSPFIAGTGPGSGSGKPNYFVLLMQRFELAHQRRYREQNAAALLDQTRWTIHQAELTNVATTTELYFAALYQKQLLDLARRSAAVNDKVLGVVQRRFKAGLATTADVTTATVSARQVRQQAKLAEANYQTALLALQRQLNLPVAIKLDLGAALADFDWLPITDPDQSVANGQGTAGESLDLAARLIEGRPDVLAASAGLAAAQANTRLARAARIPDVQAGPTYSTADDGTKFLGFQVQMDIPVLNTGAPLVRQRRAELQQQAVTYEQLRQRATLEALTAIDRYQRARRLVAESPYLAPISEKTPPEIEKITAQFQAGQASILAVFLIQDNLIREQQAHLDLLNELAQAAAGVIRATGLPLQRLLKPPAGRQPAHGFPSES
jgi:cobalt-zinc-cadmium efflux system outer membrane protein